MSSFGDLKDFSLEPLEFTDQRPAEVIFDVPFPEDLELTSTDLTITVDNPYGIIEFINPEATQAFYRIDVSDFPGTVVEWDTIPDGLTVSELNGVYAIGPILDIDTYNLIRLPTIEIPPEFQGVFFYTPSIVFQTDIGEQVYEWQVGVFVPVSQLFAEFDTDILGLKVKDLGVINLEAFVTKLVISKKIEPGETFMDAEFDLIADPTLFDLPLTNLQSTITQLSSAVRRRGLVFARGAMFSIFAKSNFTTSARATPRAVVFMQSTATRFKSLSADISGNFGIQATLTAGVLYPLASTTVDPTSVNWRTSVSPVSGFTTPEGIRTEYEFFPSQGIVTRVPIQSGWRMFRTGSGLNPSTFNDSSVSNWNTSTFTFTSEMFAEARSFNRSLNTWDVSNVTNMSAMFLQALVYNQPMNNWNTGNVTNMNLMFSNARAFNRSLNTWNVSNVTSMSSMFQTALAYNQSMSDWDVSNVTNMTNMFNMFNLTNVFNQDLGMWNIKNVNDMTAMLRDVAMSSENYSRTLIGWANRAYNNGNFNVDPGVQSNVTLGAQNVKYNNLTYNNAWPNQSGQQFTNAVAARDFLVNTMGWNIQDGGLV